MLSIIVIAKNEQERIKTCLESIKGMGEIIFADNGSTDSTLDIAKKYTENILTFKDQDFATLRNKAMERAKGKWALYIDSDERILVPLKEEIERAIQSDESGAFAISRKNIIFGQEVDFGLYKKDWVIRLLKKDAFEGWVGRVHEYPKFRGKLGYTKNSLLHLTHRDIDQIVLKSLELSKIDAKLRLEANHPPMNGWRFIRILITELWFQGIVRKGFFNGTVGVMDGLLQVFSLIITYVRLWQLQQPKPLDEIYNDIDKKLEESNFTAFK